MFRPKHSGLSEKSSIATSENIRMPMRASNCKKYLYRPTTMKNSNINITTPRSNTGTYRPVMFGIIRFSRCQSGPRFRELHHSVVVMFSRSPISTTDRFTLPVFGPNWCT